MDMTMLTSPARVVFFWALAGCALGADADTYSGAVATANPDLRPKGAHRTLRSVLKLAQTELSTRGISPVAYEATQFAYACQSGKQCEWSILYIGKVSTWQGHLAQPSMIPIVNVNDRTGRTHLLGPPPWVDVDFDDVTEKVLKGIWEAQSSGTPFKFEISGRKPHHFSLRVLSQPNCEPLTIDRYAVSVGLEPPSSKTDVRITSVELKFDGERKESNCLGLPSWLTFKFASSLHYEEAKVTVRQQFVAGPDESVFDMTHYR
jgi:hypothetical protein